MKNRFGTFTGLSCLALAVAMGIAPGLTRAADFSTSSPDDELMFNKGELNISPFATYVNQTGGKWGAGAALTYFLHENIGVGAATYWTDLGGTMFDNAEAEGYFRLPILKVVAPYAVGSVGYQFDRHYWFETIGAGVDFRPFKRIDAFSDIQYRIANSSALNGVFLRIGVRFTL